MRSRAKFLEILWHHKWFALGLFAVVMGVVSFVTFTLPKVYEVDAEISIEPKPSSVTGVMGQLAENDVRLINNQIEILRSDEMATRAAKALLKKRGLNPDKKENAAQVYGLKSQLQAGLSIYKKEYTSVLNLRYTSTGDPKELTRTLTTYLEAYQLWLRDMNSDKSKKEREFLADQLEKAELAFAKHAQALKDFQAEHKTYNMDTQVNQMLSQQNRMDDQLQALGVEIAATASKVQQSKKHLPASPEYVSFLSRLERDSQTRQIRDDIIKVESEKAEWSSKITDAHPKMIAYNQELDRLNAMLQDRLQEFGADAARAYNSNPLKYGSGFDSSLANEVVSNQIALDALRAKRAVLVADIGQVGDALSGVPDQQLAYQELKNKFELVQDRVKGLQKRLDEAILMEEVSSNFTKVDVLKKPKTPSAPIRPNTNKNLMAAVLLGVCFSLFAVFVRSTADRTFRWPFQVFGLLDENMGESVFILPKSPSKTAFRQMMEKSNFSVPEPYKRLIIHLENLSKQDQVRRIGVIPVAPTADTNIATVSLGLYLTELSNKMMLIDTDYTSHSITCLISRLNLPMSTGIDEGPGLSDYLNGDVEDFVDIIYPLGKTVYGSFIPSGDERQDSGFQFSHKNLGQLEASLSPSYNFVLYSLSSVEASYDAIAVSRTLDGVFLLAQPGYTSLDQIRAAMRELEAVNCRLLGILIQA